MAGRVAIVSGSGIDLLPLLDEVTETIPFHRFPQLGSVTVEGHEGAFVLGRCGDHRIIVQCGRLHVYEGCTFDEAGRTVDVLADLGAGTVIFTNAAGGLLPEATPGALIGADAIWSWPFRENGSVPVAVPSRVLDGCDGRGAYVWMHGPCYETRAEVRMLADWGAATVGMSTAPEMERCHALGLTTSVVSCVTNHCLHTGHLCHNHVLDAARGASDKLRGLLVANLARLNGAYDAVGEASSSEKTWAEKR